MKLFGAALACRRSACPSAAAVDDDEDACLCHCLCQGHACCWWLVYCQQICAAVGPSVTDPEGLCAAALGAVAGTALQKRKGLLPPVQTLNPQQMLCAEAADLLVLLVALPSSRQAVSWAADQ